MPPPPPSLSHPLAREGFEPAGDVVFALTADEEVGWTTGFRGLPASIRTSSVCDLSLNEGGGERCVFDGRVLYLCSVGDKMSAAFR